MSSAERYELPAGHASCRSHWGGRAWQFALLVVAVAARVAVLAWAERSPERFDFPDSHRYVRVARNIAAGLGPIDSESVRAGTDPLYPWVLSLGIHLGFESDRAVFRLARIVNAVAAVASVILLAALGRRLFGARAGLIGAAILAVDPILLYFNALVLTETLYIALLLAALYCAARAVTAGVADAPAAASGDFRAPAAWFLASGVAMGLGTLTRSTAVLLPLFMIPVFGAAAPRGRRLVSALAVLIGAAGVMTPTILRNYHAVGHFVPARTGSGPSLLEALGPWADGAPGMDRIIYPPMPEGVGEYERDRLCREAAWAWARANPGAALRLAFVKAGRTWSPLLHAQGHSSGIQQIVSVLTVVPIYLLALAGVRRLWSGRPAPARDAGWEVSSRAAEDPGGLPGRWLIALLLAPAAYFTLIHMVFVGSVRYRVPLMPLLFLLAAVALEGLPVRERRPMGASRGA
ncbi:MAG: hypothetical protein DCC65_16665 [Planctomycetota bacterium]|nr:MAG: hypothetical protein DCC65_16665 [Planctomycetota bacterium]